MLPWLAIAKLLLSVVDGIVAYAGRKQLLDAGAATQISANLQGVMTDLSKARRASDAIDHPQSQSDDDYAGRVHNEGRRPD